MSESSPKYGCNPYRKPVRIFMQDGRELPVKVLSGTPSYINFLDALDGWQLVRELREVAGFPAAVSFKYISPTGAVCGRPLSDTLKKVYWIEDGREFSPLVYTYARARSADRMSSFEDSIASSGVCGADTARLIKREVSDDMIAPGYIEEVLIILREEKKGEYNMIEADPSYRPATTEVKQAFGACSEQRRNELPLTRELLNNAVAGAKKIPESAKIDLLIALIAFKCTQNNSACYALDGQAIGIGAEQQSCVRCTWSAGQKADNWYLGQPPKVLNLPFRLDVKCADRDNAIDVYIGEESEDLLWDGSQECVFTARPEAFTREEKRRWLDALYGVSLVSDALFPFDGNIGQARRSSISYIAELGGPIRDDQVIETYNYYGIVMAFTGIRLFHH